MDDVQRTGARPSVDLLVIELQQLRVAASSPSYAVIAQRVAQRRRDRGMSDAAAQVSKTTIYRVFQIGRTRLDVALTEEVMLVLGADRATVEDWKKRYGAAQLGLPSKTNGEVGLAVQEQQPREAVVLTVPRGAHAFAVATPLVVCTLVNLLGGWLVMVTRLPLYLDMIGTAIAAVVLGPWWGVLVAACTNGGETVYDGTASLPFVIVNMAGALLWGYGVRRFGMGRTLARFFALSAGVGLLCTLLAVPILLGDFNGVTGSAVSGQTVSLAAAYHSLFAGVWWSNALTSQADKLLG